MFTYRLFVDRSSVLLFEKIFPFRLGGELSPKKNLQSIVRELEGPRSGPYFFHMKEKGSVLLAFRVS